MDTVVRLRHNWGHGTTTRRRWSPAQWKVDGGGYRGRWKLMAKEKCINKCTIYKSGAFVNEYDRPAAWHCDGKYFFLPTLLHEFL